jgi:hypothetical protein
MRLPLVALCIALVACGPHHGNGGPDGGGDDVDATQEPDSTPLPDADLCIGGTLCGIPLACCHTGNECVLDQCVPTCATGIYCGAQLDTCCAAGQVCLQDACVAPGAACTDAYDCDPGYFCEPTLSQCLPQPNPLTCKIQPTFTDLQVTLEHSYTAGHIISIPVVANLDGVGAPEIVVNTALATAGNFPDGRIVILDGATLAVKVGPIVDDRANATNPTYASHGRSTIAVGDINGDDKPDIIYAAKPLTASNSVIVAIDYTGALLWTSHLPGQTTPSTIRVENGAITLANFDGDTSAEVVIGATLLDNDGTIIWDGGTSGSGGFFGTNGTYNGGISAVADLDNDGAPEIISGKNAWKVAWNAGTPASTVVTAYWTYTGNDGYPAIADLDKNGLPEVILVAQGKIILLNGQTGTLFCAQATCTAPELAQPISIPGGTTSNIGGPPTIADFDGDGRPEIGVAGGYSYSVYDLYRPGEDVAGVLPAPTVGQQFVRWSKTTQDLSSNATGSSVFDFQGDGSSEVIYQDECNVWVYSGTDGRTQLQIPNLTGTIHEYPLVVDADGDGNSEILVVSNENGTNPNGCALPTGVNRKGLFMYGDANDKWVPTRKVWTQHSYHVTNANTAGNVPLAETNNWATPGLNDYRKNAQGEGVFNAPNLTVELAVGLDKCDQGLLSLRARVTNLGALGVFPGVVVQFRANDAAGTVLGSGTVTSPILPGGSALVTLDVSSTMTSFWAGVDGAPAVGSVAECNETDNVDAVADAHCPSIL